MNSILIFSFPYFGHTNSLINIAKVLSKALVYNIYVEISDEYLYMIENTKIKCLKERFSKYRDFTVESTNMNLESLFIYADGILNCTREYLKDLDFYKSLHPVLIIYDGYAIWGREIANKLNIPCIANLTTQIFSREIFYNNINRFLYGYIEEGMSKKSIMREIGMYEKILSKKYDNEDFKFCDCLCALGTKNFLYYYEEMSCFSSSIDDSCVLLGPYIFRNSLTIEKTKKIIYVSFGTILKLKELVINCVNAYKDMGYQIYVAAGEYEEELKEIYKQYSNIIISKCQPQINILEVADLFISHGGQNSVMESVFLGTPILSIPQANDAFILADYIENNGIGKVLLNENATREAILEAGICLMNDEEIKANLKKISAVVKQKKDKKTTKELVVNTVKKLIER